ncbi:hypothetical protein LSAT2_013250 [Lamellibrachia satsuma]|nr:hypothetical protein LSAT2_013250 [Lamellibrachia satsuma]
MRSQSGQNKRFKDTPKASIKSFDIDPESWESVAQYRHRRHSSVTHGAAVSEQTRTSIREVLGLAVDPAEHKLYFTNLANKTVEMVNVDGSGRKPIIQSTSTPYGVAVHLKRR